MKPTVRKPTLVSKDSFNYNYTFQYELNNGGLVTFSSFETLNEENWLDGNVKFSNFFKIYLFVDCLPNFEFVL